MIQAILQKVFDNRGIDQCSIPARNIFYNMFPLILLHKRSYCISCKNNVTSTYTSEKSKCIRAQCSVNSLISGLYTAAKTLLGRKMKKKNNNHPKSLSLFLNNFPLTPKFQAIFVLSRGHCLETSNASSPAICPCYRKAPYPPISTP